MQVFTVQKEETKIEMEGQLDGDFVCELCRYEGEFGVTQVYGCLDQSTCITHLGSRTWHT